MRATQLTSLAAAILLLACDSAESDPIRARASSHAGPILAGSPAVPGPEVTTADWLRLTPAMAGFPSVDARLVDPVDSGTLAVRALVPPAPSSIPPGGLAVQTLPRATLGDPPSERLAPAPPEEPEVVAAPAPRRNVRIPEPASLTLIAAGLIGLTARNRLRRSLAKHDSEPTRGE